VMHPSIPYQFYGYCRNRVAWYATWAMKSLMNIILVVLVGSFLAGCDRDDNSAPVAAVPTNVRLGFFPNLTHAQAVLGVTSGEFAAAVAPGVFTGQQFNAGPSLIEALF